MSSRKKTKKVKHKNIKNNKVLLSVLQKQKNIPKGSLLLVKEKILMVSIENSADENGVLVDSNKRNSYTPQVLEPGKLMLFLDIVWDTAARKHYFRFLSGEKILGLEFRKGETMAKFSKAFNIVSPGSYDIDKEKPAAKKDVQV